MIRFDRIVPTLALAVTIAPACGGAGTGVAPSGPQPRVLVVDPATDRFATYDKRGQMVRDYRAQLDLGPAFTARNVWVGGWFYNWDGPEIVHPTNLTSSPYYGLEEPLAPTPILIRAQSSATGPVKVRVLAPDGTIVYEPTLAGFWEAVDISPKHGYLYATRYVEFGGTNIGAVIRATDGTTVWQRDVFAAAVARDDSRFILSPADFTSPIRILDPATGVEVGPQPGTTPSSTLPVNPYAYALATLNDRAILHVSGDSDDGRLLYSIDWQGVVRPFAAELPPPYNEAYLHRFSPDGTKAFWSRLTYGPDFVTLVSSGVFELDVATNTSSPWTGIEDSCFGRPTAVWFKVTGRSLQSCACNDDTCTTVATLPPLPEIGWMTIPPLPEGVGWAPFVKTNRTRTVAVVGYGWTLPQSPLNFPDVQCYSATGELLASVPYGHAEIDETGQLLLTRPSSPGGSQDYGIVDVATGTVTWIGTPQGVRIIYE